MTSFRSQTIKCQHQEIPADLRSLEVADSAAHRVDDEDDTSC